MRLREAPFAGFLCGVATGVVLCCAVLAPERKVASRRLTELAAEKTCATPGEAADAFFLASKSKLVDRVGTDKIYRHAYHVAYAPLLAPYLHQSNVSVLEIGVQDGKSLSLWERLFTKHGRIVAIGYGSGQVAKSMKLEQNIRTVSRSAAASKPLEPLRKNGRNDVLLYYGDQSDVSFLSAVERSLGLSSGATGQKFDVIIDDGSHVPWHQIFTLEHIFDRWLADGGIYIIEDVETSYWDAQKSIDLFGYRFHAGAGSRGSAVEKLKQVVDVINRKFSEDGNYSVLRGRADHRVASITFSRNCVALVKKDLRWQIIDTRHDVLPYRPGNALNKSRVQWKRYKEESGWAVEGTPSAKRKQVR
jgi:hypothetical protein